MPSHHLLVIGVTFDGPEQEFGPFSPFCSQNQGFVGGSPG